MKKLKSIENSDLTVFKNKDTEEKMADSRQEEKLRRLQ
jgi:hypothetical protein